MPLPTWEVIGGLLLLVLLLLPLGLFLIRVGEHLLGRRVAIRPFERLLIAFYAAGGLFFVLASFPLPIFGLPLVATVLGIGGIAMALLWYLEQGRTLRSSWDWAKTGGPILIGLGAVGLLVLEVTSLGTLPAANSYDGATHALFVNVILRNRTIPWTLAPYAQLGINYPQGSPVWETLPVLLLNWPVMDSPLYLPPLFFALTVPVGYCLGCRLNDGRGRATDRMGLLCAGFLGLIAAWPRLFVGGSFDFVFALPLFLLTLGWIPAFVSYPNRPLREVVGFGLIIGIAASLSETVGLELLVLTGGFWLVFSPSLRRGLWQIAGRFAVIVGISIAFLVRSVLGFLMWYNYPGHALSPVGSLPYVATAAGPALTYRYVSGLINPFVLWKGRLSPIPVVSLAILILLVVGIVLIAAWFHRRGEAVRRLVPVGLVSTAATATMITFATAVLLLVAAAVGGPLAPIQAVTNLDEFSILMFMCLGLVAFVPLVACVGLLEPTTTSDAWAAPPERSVSPRPSTWRPKAWKSRPLAAMAIAVLLVTFGLGAATTIVNVPPYIHDHIQNLANVTSGDLAALEWAGTHLPGCARVFLAPGSAAQYLPEYSTVSIVFPAFPYSYNLSYSNAIVALTAGAYNGSVRAELLELEVNTIFVTGATTSEFAPLNATPLASSPDFSLLYSNQDAVIYSFLPGVSATGCSV